MAVTTKIFLICLLLHVACSTEGERPARTLGFLGFGSSSSSSQPKVDPQPQKQVSQVVSQVAQQQQNGRPFVYNVRYFSELPSTDRLKDRMLLYNPGQPERVPCPLDHSLRVAGHQDKVVSSVYSYQQPAMSLASLAQQASQQQHPGNVMLPLVHQQHQSVVLPQQSQTPGNVLLSVLQPVTGASSQQPGVVVPVFSPTQQAALSAQPHLLQQQQQPQPPLLQQQQQKVAPSYMLDYPYYYFYPEFVYVVPVLQQHQQHQQQLQQTHHHQLTSQKQAHQQGSNPEDARVQSQQQQQQPKQKQ